jgi:methylmalonyl-CoA mutase
MTGGTDATHLALAAEEDQHGRTEWEAAAAAVLRKTGRLTEDDADDLVWERLTRTTLDGIPLSPLGTPALLDDLRTSGRPTRAGAWDIRSRVAGSDPKHDNEAALVDLDGGVTSLWAATRDGSELPVLLDKVLLDLAPVVLEATEPQRAAEALLELADDTGVDLHPGTNFGADPLGDALRAGVAAGSTTEGGAAEQLLPTAELARRAGVLGVAVDATVVHDLGASDAQELGYSIAVGAAYLRRLTGAGIPVAEAAALIEFRYAATDEQFPTIAKLRAARRLWARVLELSASAPVPQRQHAVTSRPMMTRYDAYVNMLRVTVAAFAAGVGGADAITVLPFDSALGEPQGFGRRIARNVSHLLIDESHVHEVADPAGGSYAVERLTDDLAAAGWAELGRIEEAGGVEAALANGSLHGRIDAVVAEREAQIARRRRPITGLSEFPNLAEQLPERPGEPLVGDVRPYGAAFEALRDQPAARPVFLATLGTIAEHTARATFATNLLAAGGITVHEAGATTGVDDLLAAYDGQPVVCLAGSDATYAEWGEAAATALRAAGAGRVIIAGRPADYTDDNCAMGIDALDFLARTREALG